MQKSGPVLQNVYLTALEGRFVNYPKKAIPLIARSMSFFYTFVVRFTGELSEWLKEPASKTGVRQRTGGSNPSLTALCKANQGRRTSVRRFCVMGWPSRACSCKDTPARKKRRSLAPICFARGDRGMWAHAVRPNPEREGYLPYSLFRFR